MTAVSVARDCGMINRDESVLFLSAVAPDPGRMGKVSLQCLHGEPPPIVSTVGWFYSSWSMRCFGDS